MKRFAKILSTMLGTTVAGGCGPNGGSSLTDQGLSARPAETSQPIIARSQQSDPAIRRTGGNSLDSIGELAGDIANGEVAARIRATVNGAPIFDEEVQATAYQDLMRTQNLTEPERTKKRREVYKAALDQLVEREVVLQDAYAKLERGPKGNVKRLEEAAEKEFDRRWYDAVKKAMNIKTDDEFKAMLRQQGLSLEMIKRQWVRQFMFTEYLRQRALDKANPGHPEIAEYYEQHADEFRVGDEVDWQDIFISSTKFPSREQVVKFVQDLHKMALNGEDFARLSKQYDDGNSGKQEGRGTGKKLGEIVPTDLEKSLFQMSDGEVGPIVEISTGYHIFKLVKRQFAGTRPLDAKLQKEIHNRLRSVILEREAKKIVEDLKRKAIIEYAHSTK